MKTLRACAVITSLLLLLCCGAYPLAVTAAAQVVLDLVVAALQPGIAGQRVLVHGAIADVIQCEVAGRFAE
jgi:hypothetical protein